MNLAGVQRAHHVCNTCRARKKRCDKVLPSCRYCTERSLECRYDNSGTSLTTDATVSDNDPCRAGREMCFLDTLHMQVLNTIKDAGVSLQAVQDRFFCGFHQWLPIMSPTHFREAVLDFESRVTTPDFAVLLLTVYLIVLRPSQPTHGQVRASPRNLYLPVKLAFAQAQAFLCTSLPLVQAGILIAAYEYACGQPDEAYVSIGTCARMAGLIGIGARQAHGNRDGPGTKPDSQDLVKRNVWWSIVVIERLASIETTDRYQLLLTEFPKDEFKLPVDLEDDHQEWSSQAELESQTGALSLSAMQRSKVEGFGRQAQAVAILNQILYQIRTTKADDTQLVGLKMADDQLQAFLTLIMSEYRTPGRHCNANATVIRTLLLLHQTILNSAIDRGLEADGEQYAASSWAALDTAAKMMAEIAEHHVKHIHNIDVIPVCAAYNVQIATTHIAARQERIGQNAGKALESLKRLDEAFRRRWPRPS